MAPVQEMWKVAILVAVARTEGFQSPALGTSYFMWAKSEALHTTGSRRAVDDIYERCQGVRLLSHPSMSSPLEERGPTSRGLAIGISLSGWVGLTATAPPGRALDPIRKVQERMRIRAQEEFDNVEALASPEAGKTIQPVLTLVPIVKLRLLLDEVERDLQDPRRFDDALAILQAQDFQKKDIKRVFNAYSDNIYYLPDSGRENKYLQGGATPSTRQTLQYLLRNDVIDNVDALRAEIAYFVKEREAVAAARDARDASAAAADLDEKDLKMYLGKCKEGFDKYLGMVFQNEIDEATQMAKASLEKKNGGKQRSVSPAAGLVGS